MNRYVQQTKLGVIISNQIMSGNEKMEEIVKLFEDEQYLNMQYYMEYCENNGYVTPHEWLEKHKSF